MPVFNRERSIGVALESILGQTHQDVEAVVVDDGSTDGTPEVVRRYARKDGRIRLVLHDRNRRTPAALNTAAAEAKGQWITFLDSDDWLFPDSIELRLATARAEGVHVVNSDGLVWHQGAVEPVPWNTTGPVSGRAYSRLLRAPGTTLYFLMSRTALECFGKFDERIVTYQDWDLGIRLAKHFQFRWIDQAMFVWDQRAKDTISSNDLRGARGYEQVFRKHSLAILLRLGPRALARHYHFVSELYTQAGAGADARRCKTLGRLICPRPDRAVGRLARKLRSASGRETREGCFDPDEVRQQESA